ncbi:hypothetical protein CkaCkLH20_05202 [Colletotrichum karsti]|uniref:PA14 domain-containing protein n=1 Tax=Colletotrichum karsti TaxID=1095194 RepID=A0A9P6LMG9_9PEZI|nr:uncharacterized protein CkaCkLH20_05202 [Colletotrichum karsti]KAF9877502.1 hypothetical protein CkaCkLH20_05202 [Colletotrichum karsti]
MKRLSVFNLIWSLSGVASAAVCNNNCGRQVAGTAKKEPSIAFRSSQCGAFVTTYVTVAAGPIATPSLPPTVKGRNVHAPRQESAVPTITGIKPAYASACPDVTAYWSACQCFDGIKATTITVTAPTSVTPTSLTSATASASASCIAGAEFALHVLDEKSSLCRNVLQKEYPYVEAEEYNLKKFVQGRVPVGTGLAQSPRYSQQDDTQPINYNGVKGPAGSNFRCNIVVHRGYIKASYPGSYELYINEPEDVMFVWVGDKAKSGFNAGNADIRAQEGRNTFPYSTFIYFETVEEYIPFRIFWANGKGPGSFSVGLYPDYVLIIDLPEGVVVDNPVLYSNCSGDASPAPAWPAWQNEIWG